jgi:hypothetical protein
MYLMTSNAISDATSTAPMPSPAMAIMIAKAAMRPLAATTAGDTPCFAPLVTDSRLLGPKAMLMAKQAGRKSR